MTTTSLPDSDSSAPRKGLGDPAAQSGDLATLSNLVTGTALADTNPTPTPVAVTGGIGDNSTNNNNNNGDRNGDRFRGNGNNGNRNKNNNSNNEKGLDPVAERVLISVGSIGEI